MNLSDAGKAQVKSQSGAVHWPTPYNLVLIMIKNGALLSKIGPVALRGKTKRLFVM